MSVMLKLFHISAYQSLTINHEFILRTHFFKHIFLFQAVCSRRSLLALNIRMQKFEVHFSCFFCSC